MAMATFSKVFILDKYFSELQKFWETEKKLQGTITTHSCLMCPLFAFAFDLKNSESYNELLLIVVDFQH